MTQTSNQNLDENLNLIENELNELNKLNDSDNSNQTSPSMYQSITHAGTVAVIGRPNVGKSTLINALIKQKVSITSKKAQTTRHQIIGILNANQAQYVFVDTPGFQTKYTQSLNKQLNKTVMGTVKDVDVVLMLIDKPNLNDEDKRILELIPKTIPIILICNKIDLLPQKQAILPFLQALNHNQFNIEQTFAEIIPATTHQEKYLNLILDVVKKYLPEQAALYDEDYYTTQSQRFLAQELIREKLFRFTGDELPYQSTVVIEQFIASERLHKIFATIYVERASHKKIIIGEKGQRIKQISQLARLDLEKQLDLKIYLELWVKIKTGAANMGDGNTQAEF